MEIILFVINTAKEQCIYTIQEMINNPEQTIISLLIGVFLAILYTFFKWIDSMCK